MKAWIVDEPKAIDEGPLVRVEREIPEAGPGEIRVRVTVCGVCRTDLHLAVGELVPKRHGVVPGHEVVGVVDAAGADCIRFGIGDRVGIALAAQHLWAVPMVPSRPREPVCRVSFHGMGRRRWLRRMGGGRRGVRIRNPRRVRR